MTVRGAVRLILLSVLLGLSVFALVTSTSMPPQSTAEGQQVSRTLPEVTPPTGPMGEVFHEARPATLQIEMRSVRSLRSEVVGVGTGFFISADGLVLSAYHVVDPPAAGIPRSDLQLVGVGHDEERYSLELVGFDAYFDLALLQAEVNDEVPFIPLAERSPRVGTDVVAIGNSRGEFLEGRAGRVTGLGVAAPRPDLAENTIALNAALSPGDSGGPVLNPDGEVVGVVSYISYGTRDSPFDGDTFVPPYLRGLIAGNNFASFAIPVSRDGNDVIDAVLAGEQRDVPVIGFTWGQGYDYDPESPRWAGAGLGPRPGVIVRTVEPGGPADLAGLRSYQEHYSRSGDDDARTVEADVITAVNGIATPGFYELLAEVRKYEIGDAVTLEVQRGTEVLQLELTLAPRRSTFSQ